MSYFPSLRQPFIGRYKWYSIPNSRKKYYQLTMKGKLLLATILCLMGVQALGEDILEGNYNVTAVCTAVKVGTQLGSIESCQTYYVCKSTGPEKASCQTGYSYDYQRSSCYPSSEVSCYWGVENPCGGKNATWVPNTFVCGGWFYCLDGESAGSGKCPSNQKFDATTAGCTYGSCATTDSTDGVVLDDLCDVVPPSLYFGDTSDCATWHYCESTSTGIVLRTGKCDNIYNALTGQCAYSSTGACSRVTGIPLGDGATVSCTTNGGKTPDATVCGKYYVCTNKVNVATYCETGYYFDVKTFTCRTRQLAVPVEGCNRCQYATTMFVNAVNSDNCSTYYYCNKEGQATLNTCPDDTFFNESAQGCAPDENLETYVENNGACYGATASDSESTTPSTE
ncbi:uncharacterized protein Dyak_GE22942 [Drosophila yakuba]|uniref:Chitin-binding type-2 domain-containing protein n=1 Tax=Drosophila yakuba TaxID=7245 RepID=B4ITJ7_DROYA|nr:uncharacterized protein Dyak_GE22942 [Drosophila yakuba]